MYDLKKSLAQAKLDSISRTEVENTEQVTCATYLLLLEIDM